MKPYATITIELHKAGLHVRCEEIDVEEFISKGGDLTPLVDIINLAEEACNPDVEYVITEKGKEYLKELEKQQDT